MIRLALFAAVMIGLLISLPAPAPGPTPSAVVAAAPTSFVYAPLIVKPSDDGWFQFRHDAQRTGATLNAISGPLQVRWKQGFEAWPAVFAELTVADGRVFVANTDGIVTALDAQSGTKLWEYDTGATILSTPAIANSQIHVVNITGRVVALSTATGGLIWEKQLGVGVYASPALVSDRLLIGTMAGTMLALSTSNGNQLWSFSANGAIDAAPAVAGGRVFFAAADMQAYALELSSGSLIWQADLPGARSWNAHPVASESAGKVFFSPMPEIYQPTSTHREVIDMYLFEDATGALDSIATTADDFIDANRQRLQPAVIYNTSDGSEVTNFSLPSGGTLTALPFSSWYWGSIRPVLWQGNKLVLQSMWRTIIVDLNSKQVYQPNANQQQTGQFVRGDEQVPISLAGNQLFGGIGTSVSTLNLTNGQRSTIFGRSGEEGADFTPITAPLSSEAQHVFAGNGASDRIGTLIVVDGLAYYQQYGWVYCFETGS
ncbi:MAG: hypothetical protein Fur005_01580 [Roseiflexaceae bacterium]